MSNDVSTTVKKPLTIESYLIGEGKSTLIERIEKYGVTTPAEKIISFALSEYKNNKGLHGCTTESFMNAILRAVELNLPLSSSLGYIYLLPFNNKGAGTKEITFVLGYKGMLALLHRNPLVKKVNARSIYSNEKIVMKYGTEDVLEHYPLLTNKGDLVGFYADVTLEGGVYKYELLSLEEVYAIRDNSPSYKFLKTDDDRAKSIWGKNFEQMAHGKAIRKLCKTLSVMDAFKTNDYFKNAIDQDEDYSIVDSTAETIDSLTGEVSSVDALANKLTEINEAE
jgi:recombination protein RecT